MSATAERMIEKAAELPPTGHGAHPFLGKFLRDRASGVEGFGTSLHELLSGTVRIGLQPQSGDATALPDPYEIDEQLLEIIDENKSLDALPVATNVPFLPLGAEVKDRISGLKGVITGRVTFLSGCVYYKVTTQGKTDRLGSPIDTFLSAQRITLRKAEAKAAKEMKAEASPTGGPTVKAFKPS
jgi:hypothetical protein